MYLSGKVSIDPSQLTHLDRVKPTKGFARLAHVLTGGLVTTQEERETFSAVAILQQINIVMRSLGIDNVIRLSKDDTVFYHDTEGKQNDLKEALTRFSENAQPTDLHGFQTLELALEHRSAHQIYLIQIHIHRTHGVGEHPIQITINGIPKKLSEVAQDSDRRCLTSIFSSQQTYDAFCDQQRNHFANFLMEMECAFKQHMRVDEVRITSATRIIRPSKNMSRPADAPRRTGTHHDPMYDDDYGFGDLYFYAWLWEDLSRENDIQCNDCTIVDSTGAEIQTVGEVVFSSAQGDTINVDPPSTPPIADESQGLQDNEFAAEISDESTRSFEVLGGETRESGGWLSSIGDFFGDSGGDSGGGSCGGSSCGGCGGD